MSSSCPWREHNNFFDDHHMVVEFSVGFFGGRRFWRHICGLSGYLGVIARFFTQIYLSCCVPCASWDVLQHCTLHPATRFGCMLMLQLIVFCSCIADGQVASDCNSGGTQATADVELLTSKASAILRFLQESSQIECRSQDACHAAMPPFQPLSTASWLLGKHYRAGKKRSGPSPAGLSIS
eukprot:scaffold3700_cov84-Skeletonema_marinoi.AAC.7